jgi:hypothetical protein
MAIIGAAILLANRLAGGGIAEKTTSGQGAPT